MAEAGTESRERMLVGVFATEERAKGAVEALIDRDYPMDMLSLLGRHTGTGDDPMGLYYHTAGERARGWGKMGAFWGGIWGLLTGAAGMFLIPGLGPLIAAGPIVEALAGGVGGAAIGGGVMAGAGAVSHLTTGLRNAGVPEEEVDRLHHHIEQGHMLILLRCRQPQCDEYRSALEQQEPQELHDLPFRSLVGGR